MVDLNLPWTAWRPLKGSAAERGFPDQPGLYRVRRAGQPQLDYVGQTGRPVRRRLADLRGVYAAEMPFRDPHTAAPGLWALVQQGAALEVSVAGVPGDDPTRKAVEAAVISLHRAAFGCSPTVNFGRMPAGYAMSTDRRRGVRGGLCADPLRCHLLGLPLAGPLNTYGAEDWGGHAWSAWQPLANVQTAVPAGVSGLYLIRRGAELLYVGQGLLRSRLGAHHRKPVSQAQGRLFQAPGVEQAFAVLPGVASHQLQELENDLIASFFLCTGRVPAAQFLGDRDA
jgi:hypothetical protein